MKIENHAKLESVLRPFGLEYDKELGMFFSGHIGFAFDFSGCTPETVLKVIFDKGFNVGVENNQQMLREALGI